MRHYDAGLERERCTTLLADWIEREFIPPADANVIMRKIKRLAKFIGEDYWETYLSIRRDAIATMKG